MHKITIILNNSSSNLQLTFKDEQKARAIHTTLQEALNTSIRGLEDHVTVEDEYGHRLSIIGSSITAALLTNTVEELNYTVDVKILEHRAQNRLQQAVQMDPVNKLSIGGRA